MEVVKKSSASEVVLEWLKAGLYSDRFSEDLRATLQSLGCTEKIITSAQLTDENENQMRWQILKTYRNWLDRNFHNYNWTLVTLSREEVCNLHYIDYSYWNELSDNTRKVGQAAQNVANGKVVFDVPNDRFHAVAKSAEVGENFLPIIVVSNLNDNEGEILEGHLRATGYVLAKQATKHLKAIWGTLHQ